MTATDTVSPADRLTIVKLLAGGRDTGFVAEVVRLDVATVARFASAHGFPDTAKLAWAVDILAKKIADEARAAIPAATTTSVAATATIAARRQAITPTTMPVRSDPVAELLADAAASKRKRTRDLGERATKALDLVRAELAAERDRDSAARARVEAEAKIRAEVTRLEKRLAELKGGLSKSAAVPAGVGAYGLESKAVRAWAKANDVPCTVTGRVPRTVVEAYQAAHRGAA